MLAVLLIAHGSRRAEANADLDRVADALRQPGDYPIVETSYLDVAQPDIPTGGSRCVDRGATQVLMLPYFLSAGSHVVDDLTHYCRELSERFPRVTFHVCPPLGLHPLMLDIVRARVEEGRRGLTT